MCLLVQPKERCLECGELFEIEILSEHVSQCCSRCKIMSKPKAVLYYLVPFHRVDSEENDELVDLTSKSPTISGYDHAYLVFFFW